MMVEEQAVVEQVGHPVAVVVEQVGHPVAVVVLSVVVMTEMMVDQEPMVDWVEQKILDKKYL
jgi:hypothetical protein